MLIQQTIHSQVHTSAAFTIALSFSLYLRMKVTLLQPKPFEGPELDAKLSLTVPLGYRFRWKLGESLTVLRQ